MEPDSNLWPWLIIGLAVLLVVLATAIEVVFAGVSHSDLRKLVERRDARALLVDKLLTDANGLSTTLLLLKSAGLVIVGAIAVQFVIHTVITQGIVVAFTAWLIFVILQVTTRALVLHHEQALVLKLAPLAWRLVQLCQPLSTLLHIVSTWLGGHDDAKDEVDALLHSEDLRELMHVNEEKNSIEASEKQMIASILEMVETVVREVMVPRIDMVAIDVETSLHEALDLIITAGHSRIPVYEEHVDQILGILYAKDLLKCFRDQRTDAPIRELLRPPYFVPVSKKVHALLKEMQQGHVHIAVVVDEYGGIAGLVTIEDLIEEIVGDIQDEYDNEEDVFVEAIGANVYMLNARLDLYSLSKLLDVELPDEDVDTLGGLIYSLLGHVPEQGEAVELAGWRFTVLSLDGQRIDHVRAELIATPPSELSEADAAGSSKTSHATGGNSLYDFQGSDS
ncbi:MAG: hemolysin family protein [Chloroflexi bacterium]|nr:hemolysin family protein [Chloroflexota bacterium]